MNLKPIEPGCRAWITHSDAGNSGEVTVVKLIGRVHGFTDKYGPRWEIDRTIRATVFFVDCNHLGESQLMRIDGYEETDADAVEEKEHENTT